MPRAHAAQGEKPLQEASAPQPEKLPLTTQHYKTKQPHPQIKSINLQITAYTNHTVRRPVPVKECIKLTLISLRKRTLLILK